MEVLKARSHVFDIEIAIGRDTIPAKVGAGLVASRRNRKDNSETRPYTITFSTSAPLFTIYLVSIYS
ncbi:hypothetical protein [Coleofasciculus sp.]|uniref:hypothetical protein n=1 Tax=Coleofasciculus sp. TaxID=3100458 RepID=UPI003A3D6EFC